MTTAPTTETRTDEQIQQETLAELKYEPRVTPNEIGVVVKNGVVALTGWVDSYTKGWVTLKGEVEWEYQKEDAERVVRRLTGVKGVVNSITVKPRLTPSELKEKIEKALVRSAETDAERIQVEVQGSKVILRGIVR